MEIDLETQIGADGKRYEIGEQPTDPRPYRRWPGGVAEPNTQTGTAYTVANSDMNGLIIRNNASASTQTWPADDNAPHLPIGTEIVTANIGAGTVTHAADEDATLVTGSATSHARGKLVTGIKVAADTWLLTISG